MNFFNKAEHLYCTGLYKTEQRYCKECLNQNSCLEVYEAEQLDPIELYIVEMILCIHLYTTEQLDPIELYTIEKILCIYLYTTEQLDKPGQWPG